ncbi:MAG: SIR2 family protein [Pseudomonadota bacterium]|nr:SIR2 family protein [Pseudomonadota bacterium]
MNLPVEVIDAVRAKRCVIFLGSRATHEAAELVGATYPDAKTLAKDLGWKKPKIVPGQKPKVVLPSVEEGAAAYEAANGRAALVRDLQARIGAADLAPTAAHTGALKQFPLLFTTCMDDLLERAAADQGVRLDVLGRADKLPESDPTRRVLVKLRGGFERPDSLMLTPADFAARPVPVDVKKQLRTLVRNQVILFVGYRPDEEEFERLFGELSDAYGGELPRCHLASAQGPIDDYLWQKWVWRGLLLFTADPVECLNELENQVP